MLEHIRIENPFERLALRIFCLKLADRREFSSVGLERLVYTQKVGGSNPSTPTAFHESRSLATLYMLEVQHRHNGHPLNGL